MAIQTSYSERIADAREGMIANMSTAEIVTGEVETSGGIGFGLAVYQGTAADQIELGGVAGANPFLASKFLGVTVRDRTRAPDDDEYKQGANAAVLVRGDIWVKVEAAVTVGADVSFKETTGQFSTASGSATQAVVPRARWMTAAAAGGLAVLRLDTSQIGAA